MSCNALAECDKCGVIDHPNKLPYHECIPEEKMMDIEQVFEDLNHVSLNFVDPKLPSDRMQELIDLGWIVLNGENEIPHWEITYSGWETMEQLGMVSKPYG